MTHLEDLQEGDIARIVYRSDKSGNTIEVAGEVEMHTTTDFAEGTAHNIRIKDRENDRLLLAHTEPSDNRNGEVKSVTNDRTQKLGILREVSGAKVYRVWWNESHPAGGDRREVARYRAFTIDEVVEAVKEDHIAEEASSYEMDGYVEPGEEERVSLKVENTIDPVEEGILSQEEYENLDEYDKSEVEAQSAVVEVVMDNSATFPMKMITGGSAGRDLTGAE